MHPDLSNKNVLLVVRLVLFSCALFVILAGFVGAFVLSSEAEAFGYGLENLATITFVLSPISFVFLVIGKNYLSRVLESRSGEARLQAFIAGMTFLAAVCEAPGLLWALCAYLLHEPVYSIGAIVHAIGIMLLWPDGSEIDNGLEPGISEGTE